MGKWFVLLVILLIFLDGCITGEVVLDAGNETNKTSGNETSIVNKDVDTLTTEDDEKMAEYNKKRQRELEAYGFGIFNYSVLNKDTCAGHYENMQEKIRDLKDDVKDADENFVNQKEDVDELEKELEIVKQSGNENAVKHLEERIDGEEDEMKEAEDYLDEISELYRRHIVIKNHIKEYCLELKVSV